MNDLYQEELLDHYHHPHNYGTLEQPTCTVSETNASCGDSLTLQLKVEKLNNASIVTDVRFEGIGCAVSMASTSLLTDYIKGKSVEELQAIDFPFMQQLIGTVVSPGRIKCLTLSARALLKALNQAIDKLAV